MLDNDFIYSTVCLANSKHKHIYPQSSPKRFGTFTTHLVYVLQKP